MKGGRTSWARVKAIEPEYVIVKEVYSSVIHTEHEHTYNNQQV